MKLEKATVISHERVYTNTYLIWLSCPPVARGAAPGRFLMLHCSDALDPLLPRPMSFHRFATSPLAPSTQQLTTNTQQLTPDFAILYDVRGRGTDWLSRRKPGDEITVFGPLGRGYDLKRDTQNVLLVAGGLGVAAVISLADEAVAAGQHVTLLQGRAGGRSAVPARPSPHRRRGRLGDGRRIGWTSRAGDGVAAEVSALGGPGVRLRAEPDVRRDGEGRPRSAQPKTGAGPARGAHGLRDRRLLRVRGVHT